VQIPTHVSEKGVPDPAAKIDYTPWYLVSLVLIILTVVIAVLVLELIRPTADNTQLISTLVGIALLAIPALLGFVKSAENGAAIQVYHQAVNSKMDSWIFAAEELARLQGAEAGRLLQVQSSNKAATDALALVTAAGGLPAAVAPTSAPTSAVQMMIDHSEQWARIFH
jgi:NADH:ubiquinone oxidoreductase subunit 2 (subunit N)